jgi:hypothetical protein
MKHREGVHHSRMSELVVSMSGSQLGNFAHNASDIEVFWCVDRSDALIGQAGSVFFGDDSADNNRGINALCPKTTHHIGH